MSASESFERSESEWSRDDGTEASDDFKDANSGGEWAPPPGAEPVRHTLPYQPPAPKEMKKVKAALNIGVSQNTERGLRTAIEAGDVDGLQNLLGEVAEIDVPLMGMEEPLLTYAVMKGHLPIVRALVDFGADVNNNRRMSALVAAVRGEKLDIVQYLLSKGANPNSTGSNFSGKSFLPISIAVFKNNIPIAKALLEAGAELTVGERGALANAARAGQIDMVRLLMAHDKAGHGRSEATRDEIGHALIRAASAGRTAVVETILDTGIVNVNFVGQEGTQERWALYAAAAEGHVDTIHALIARGAMVDLTAREAHKTALMCAKNAETARLLISYGADAGYCLRTGGTVATQTMAADGTLEHVRLILDAGGVVAHEPREKRLECAGAYIDEGPQDEGNALLIAVMEGAGKEMLRLLLDRGARVNENTCMGPLMEVACSQLKSTKSLTQLLHYGGTRTINTPGIEGQTALMRLIEKIPRIDDNGTDSYEGSVSDDEDDQSDEGKGEEGEGKGEEGEGEDTSSERGDDGTLLEVRPRLLPAVEELLLHGADPCARDEDGRSALTYAYKVESIHLYRLLIDFGANKQDLADKSEYTYAKIADYERKPRFPLVVPIQIGTTTLHLLPWAPTPHFYAFAPTAFQQAVRALCLLRGAAACEPTWGCLPAEIFELCVSVLWREDNIARQWVLY